MLDTRTPRRTHRTCGDLSALPVHTKGPGWTARTASPRARTASAARHKAKTHFISKAYDAWTAWTAISGFFMMRVRLHVRKSIGWPMRKYECLASHKPWNYLSILSKC